MTAPPMGTPRRPTPKRDTPGEGIDVAFRDCGLASGRESLRRYTRQALGAAMAALGWQEAGVSVLYCGDAEIQRLNKQFRAIDKPTDILSFPSAEDPESLRGRREPVLGDLAIALPYTARNAAEHGRAVEDEIALLLVHGLLHLLGWDHATKAQEKLMWGEQARLLATVAPLRKPKIALAPSSH